MTTVVRLYLGRDAEQLLDSPPFLREWAALYHACSWATCFQDAPFVTTWYRCYAEDFEPVIVAGETDGRLSGLFTLATDKRSGALCAAGAHQAEYHVWLALPGDGARFIEEALDELSRVFPRGHLQLLFAPPKTPVEWTKRWSGRCYLRPIPKPLMVTRPADSARESLRKKSNKSRLSRLEKEGPLNFAKITGAEGFRAALEVIGDLSDFRQGAVNGVLPFQADRHKKAFYIALLEQPGLMHVTVLRVGQQIAAAHIGPCNREEVVLGILVHSPFFARHSCGKLHLLLLGLTLEQDGFRALDLTPGGEFKERFATRYDEASVLDIFFSRSAVRAFRWKRASIGFGKRFVSTNRVKQALRMARHKASLVRPRSILNRLLRPIRRFCYEHREYRVYRYAAEAVPQPVAKIMRRDCLPDLTLYMPAEAWQPPLDEFLREAAKRLEAGEHAYTFAQDGRLAHHGWLIERQQEAFISEVSQKLRLPPDSAVLYDFYTRPEHRGKGFYQRALAQMTYDAAKVPGIRHIYIGALKENLASCHAIEKAGFEHQQSLFETRRLGKIKRW